LNSKVGELEKLREELDKKGALLSAAARKEKQETLERKLRDFQRLKDDSERELAKKEQELSNKFLADIVGVVERIGKQRGFLMIVEKVRGGVIYGAPDADLTDEVIKAFDQEAGKGKK
jgi:outer membrane protein